MSLNYIFFFWKKCLKILEIKIPLSNLFLVLLFVWFGWVSCGLVAAATSRTHRDSALLFSSLLSHHHHCSNHNNTSIQFYHFQITTTTLSLHFLKVIISSSFFFLYKLCLLSTPTKSSHFQFRIFFLFFFLGFVHLFLGFAFHPLILGILGSKGNWKKREGFYFIYLCCMSFLNIPFSISIWVFDFHDFYMKETFPVFVLLWTSSIFVLLDAYVMLMTSLWFWTWWHEIKIWHLGFDIKLELYPLPCLKV